MVIVIAGLCLATTAFAQSKRYPPEPVDKDEEDAKKSNLWEKASNPQRKPYDDLLAEAQNALDDKQSSDAAREAADKLTQAIALLPDEPRAYRMRGDAYTAMRQWTKCADDFAAAVTRVKRNDPDVKAIGDVRKKLGLCQARAGKLADAEKTLGDAAAAGGGSGEIWVRLGEVRIAMGKLDEAIAALESAAEQTDVALPLVRWLLMGAYDRARKPALAAEVGHLAIEGRQEDGPRLARDREMMMLKNPAMPLLGQGESEYLQALAGGYFDPPRPEQSLVYFRKFLQVAPDSPWRKRAEEHLRELKAADLPEYVDKGGGNAVLDVAAARLAVRRVMPQLRACLAKQPGMIFKVTLTKTGPRTTDPRAPIRRGIPPEGTTTTVQENLDGTGSVERDNAIKCTELVTDKLRGNLPAIKEKDTWYRATFLIVGP